MADRRRGRLSLSGKLLWIMLVPLLAWGSTAKTFKWSDGETYLMFLERTGLPQSLYYNIDREDQTLSEEIRSGTNCWALYDDNQSIEQVLIPVSEELQIHIFRDGDGYGMDTVPVIYETRREALVIEIENSPYYDILKHTGSKSLAHAFVAGFKNSLNFRRDLRKGDKLVMIYDQKYRLGQPYSLPTLVTGMIEMRGKRHAVYLNDDERYYNEDGAQVEGFLLARPVRNARISSGFTPNRWHPILKRYRAHLGVDYAAPTGTPIMAAGSGKVIFAGYTRGYGNLIKIRHSDGYMTLYAHQKKFRSGIHVGSFVKKGQVIGYVGTTGLSTGPHLHFGLYKNGRAINPARVVQVTTKKLSGSQRKAFLKLKEQYDGLQQAVLDNPPPVKACDPMDPVCYITTQAAALAKDGNGTL